MSACVVVADLRKHYGAVEAVRGISFSISPGEIVGLLGPNGAGKTTTLECLLGLREPDQGTILVGGLDARLHRREVQQKIGVVLQSTALPDRITPREALKLFGSFYRQRIEPPELIERFTMGEFADAAYVTLSGGQRQRLALALAFVNRPQVVVLDEPTTGLDPQSRQDLHMAIRQMTGEGCAVLFSTHYLEEAERLCDRLAIIDRGKIVATGKTSELIAQSDEMQSVTLVATRVFDRDHLAKLPGVTDLHCEGLTARFRVPNTSRLLADLGAWLEAEQIEVRELLIKKASLEELFLRLTTNGEEKETR